MPLLIEYMDAVARRLSHDLLFFGPMPGGSFDDDSDADWLRAPAADSIREWLDAAGVAHGICGPTSNSGWIEGGPKYLYLELPYDADNADYQRLCAFVQDHDDGRTRWPDIRFCVLTLANAMKAGADKDRGFD